MNWRLGIDLGTNSLGWWAYKLKKTGSRWEIEESLGGGVYIFPDGREPAKGGRVGDSNAVRRRLARSMRRNRDRRKTRLRAFMKELVRLGLMPASQNERDSLFQTQPKSSDLHNPHYLKDPYYLRAQASEHKVSSYELGRALYHLGLRRGFKSNRIAESSDEDGGTLNEGMTKLQNILNEKQMTLGQFLWDQHQNGRLLSGIRFRGENEFYPNRSMYADEFDEIRKTQEPHHSLRPSDWTNLREYVLFQHPLKPVERGPCEFFPDEPRHWRGTPIGHDFRIYQELNNLLWIDADQRAHPLDDEQRTLVLRSLMSQKSDVKFDVLRRKKRKDKTLMFEGCVRFNLEGEKRKGLKSHLIGAILAKDKELSALWEARCSAQGDNGMLDDIFEDLYEKDDPEELKKSLADKFELSDIVINKLIEFPLPRTTASVSKKFMEQIVPIMRDQRMRYDEAVGEIPDEDGVVLHHSHQAPQKDRVLLPYYGEILKGSLLGADPNADNPEQRFGKINNPTVHVALNSLRRVVNALIERFGHSPTEIHVELLRELKQPRKVRDEITKRQNWEQKENERIKKELQSYNIMNPSPIDIKKVKLWEELGEKEFSRRCPFSGQPIAFASLMNGEAEIEHILPFKRTLDNSMSNLTVAMRWANRLKGNRTPFEAFATNAHSNEGITWETVRSRAEKLPANKSWRFGPDAMSRYEDEHDFIARQLTDSAYIAKIAVRYLQCLKGVEQIVPNRGSLTSLLRGKWRLNKILSADSSKNREDHRHHAVDAAVIGFSNRAVLQDVANQTARDNSTGREHIEVSSLPDDIKESLHEQVAQIVVAYKPDHGYQGPMFNESAYGFVTGQARDPDMPEYNLVIRKPLLSLADTKRQIQCIRDPKIRKDIKLLVGDEKDKKEIRMKLQKYSEQTGIKKIRILVADQTVAPIASASYKGYAPDSYVCCDIWRMPDGKKGNWVPNKYNWRGVFWPYRDTPQGVPKPIERQPHPAAKFVCRLFKNDMVVYGEEDATQIMRVAGFSTTNNKLAVAHHTQANAPQQFVSINVLGEKGIRKVYIAPDGVVRGL